MGFVFVIFFSFLVLLEDGNGLGKILLKISTVYKNSCCQVRMVFLQLIVALKGMLKKVIFVSELQASPARQKSMSLSRMKSWLLGYIVELCYNLDIIRLFIKAAERSNQSWSFLRHNSVREFVIWLPFLFLLHKPH